jgi:16S rRNA (uracil1498-N3)-methyltransferase
LGRHSRSSMSGGAAPRHRFFVAAEQVLGHDVRFTAEQTHQLRHVLRLAAGDQVRVFDGDSATDLLVVLASAERGQVVGTVPRAPEPRTRLVGYSALTRRDKFEQVLQKLTEVGVAAIVPVLTMRALVRRGPDERQRQRWKAILREAAEQSGRGVVPGLLPAVSLAAALRDATAAGAVLIAYEGGGATLRQALSQPHPQRSGLSHHLQPAPALPLALDSDRGLRGEGRTVSLFVGPEGGFDPSEVALATRLGARLVTLGPRIMRTETAAPVFAALVLYELGDLSSPQDDDPHSQRP